MNVMSLVRYMSGLVSMVMLFGCMGCSTTSRNGWALRVGNSGAEPIHDVTVTFQNGHSQTASAIRSLGVSSDMALGRQSPTGMIRVAWVGDLGSNYVQDISLTNRTDRAAGRIILDIKEGRPIRIFVHDEAGQFLGEIPWGNSADWDGTVAFPIGEE